MNKLDQMDWIRLDDFKNSPCESLESVEDRMKAKAESVLKERLCLYGKSMGIQPNKVIVKSQKKRWGSCSSSGIIRLNWKCVLLKPEVMDYIIVHELCHLREMNHSKLFWKEVEKILPDYKDRQDQLKKIKFEC
jgi:predicted metal-dependent hydrolase